MRLSVFLLLIVFNTTLASEHNLHPDFPIVEGAYQMTDSWVINLDQAHNRRFENNSLVIWRPGFTLWINVWNNDNEDTIDTRLNWFKNNASEEAFEEAIIKNDNTVTYKYRLLENNVHAMDGLVFSDDGHVQVAAYFDEETDHQIASIVIDGIEHKTP